MRGDHSRITPGFTSRGYQDRLRWRAVSPLALGGLVALLIIPGLALYRLGGIFDPRWVFGGATLASLIALLLYRHDKKRAIEGGWRTPESTLHFVELLGGWPGAYLAQRVFRHKNAKTSFQCIFWLIVLAHQFVAYDFLNDWRLSKRALRAFENQTASNGPPATLKADRLAAREDSSP